MHVACGDLLLTPKGQLAQDFMKIDLEDEDEHQEETFRETDQIYPRMILSFLVTRERVKQGKDMGDTEVIDISPCGDVTSDEQLVLLQLK